MSRIGKKPIPLPAKVSVEVAEDNQVTVRGPRGELEQTFPASLGFEVVEGEVLVTRPNDDREQRALHGLARALLANMVAGVSEGWQKRLELQGVGYRAEMEGQRLRLRVGFSHEVYVEPPEGLEVSTEGTTVIVVQGNDRCAVGQLAADIRRIRPVEPYKGKGIRYVGERVRRKAGKQAKVGG